MRSEIETILAVEKKNSKNSLFRCIFEKRDYPGLYPTKKQKGASPKLYLLYQRRVCNHSTEALQIAHSIANRITLSKSKKEIERLKRPEAIKDGSILGQTKIQFMNLTSEGKASLEDYQDLFKQNSPQGVTIDKKDTKIIFYYLYHATEEIFFKDSLPRLKSNTRYETVKFYAAQVYNRYIKEKGGSRFKREVILQSEHKLGIKWFMNQFVKLAESEDGFTYGQWVNLCKLDNGRIYVNELLFQMHLLWIKWINENKQCVEVNAIPDVNDEYLPRRISDLLHLFFEEYLTKRAIKHFQKEILLPLRKGDIGLTWFKYVLSKPVYVIPSLTDNEWEELLVGERGINIAYERRFQMNLLLSNLYKNKVK